MSNASPLPLGRWPARAASRPRLPGLDLAGWVAVAMLLAAGWRIWLSFDHMLWLDELYTTTLIATPSFAHLWSGATQGVDGNPPLYLSLAWALTQAIPIAPEWVLRPLNLAFLVATAVLLFRLGRRVADPASVAAALAAVCAVDSMAGYALLEVRTYALYLFLVTATLSATLAVVDRPSPGRVAMLGGLGILAVGGHSFGGFYVLATFGGAGLACLALGERRRTVALVIAAVPVTAATLAWISLSLPAQLAVATPYGWIPRPSFAALLDTLTGSLLLTLFAAAAGAAALRAGFRLRRGREADIAEALPLHAPRRDVMALYATLAAYAALTVAGWIGSQVITPFFVDRYFIPNLLIGALAIVPTLGAARRRLHPRLFAAVLALCILGGLGTVAREAPDADGLIPCRDVAGRFLEEDAAGGGLPVVTESAQAWMPRSRYAPGQTTLYPLDWQTVLRHPDRARNNAMDFHIMEILKGWAAPGSALATGVMTTEELLARHPRFLLLDQPSRAWFDDLRARTPLSATLLGQSGSCRLWQVDTSSSASR